MKANIVLLKKNGEKRRDLHNLIGSRDCRIQRSSTCCTEIIWLLDDLKFGFYGTSRQSDPV